MGDTEISLDVYLKRMVELGASDLFLCGDVMPAYRVGGRVIRDPLPAPDHERMAQFSHQVLTPVAAERFARSPDVDAGYTLAGVGRFRINLFASQGRTAMVVRLIPLGAVSFADLHLPSSIIEMADRPHGLVLVVGPTGCGKSTTLAAMIHHINTTREQHIVTVEDPIEFVHVSKRCLVHQRQVGFDTKDFATALRHVVRQSPDVILIGEMRDADTVQTALAAALTGHLVLSTLHTSNVVQSIDRMLNYFPPEARHQAQVDLAATLVGMVAMRLIPARDGQKRVPAVEILRATPTVRRVIAENALHELADLMKRGGDFGMLTLNQSLVQLVREGSIDEAAAYRTASNRDELKLNLQGMFTGIDSIRLAGSMDEEQGGRSGPL